MTPEELIDADLLIAVAGQESRSYEGGQVNNNAVSPVGARGAFQIMPDMWNAYADPGDDPFAVEPGAKVATRILRDEAKRYGSDLKLTLAAYNAGSPRVNQAIERATRLGIPTDFDSMKQAGMFQNSKGERLTEVEDYVPQVLARYNEIKKSKAQQNAQKDLESYNSYKDQPTGTIPDYKTEIANLTTSREFLDAPTEKKMAALDRVYKKRQWVSQVDDAYQKVAEVIWKNDPTAQRPDPYEHIQTYLNSIDGKDEKEIRTNADYIKKKIKNDMKERGVHPAIFGNSIDEAVDRKAAKKIYDTKGVFSTVSDWAEIVGNGAIEAAVGLPVSGAAALVGAEGVRKEALSWGAETGEHDANFYVLNENGEFIPDSNGQPMTKFQGTALRFVGNAVGSIASVLGISALSAAMIPVGAATAATAAGAQALARVAALRNFSTIAGVGASNVLQNIGETYEIISQEAPDSTREERLTGALASTPTALLETVADMYIAGSGEHFLKGVANARKWKRIVQATAKKGAAGAASGATQQFGVEVGAKVGTKGEHAISSENILYAAGGGALIGGAYGAYNALTAKQAPIPIKNKEEVTEVTPAKQTLNLEWKGEPSGPVIKLGPGIDPETQVKLGKVINDFHDSNSQSTVIKFNNVEEIPQGLKDIFPGMEFAKNEDGSFQVVKKAVGVKEGDTPVDLVEIEKEVLNVSKELELSKKDLEGVLTKEEETASIENAKKLKTEFEKLPPEEREAKSKIAQLAKSKKELQDSIENKKSELKLVKDPHRKQALQNEIDNIKNDLIRVEEQQAAFKAEGYGAAVNKADELVKSTLAIRNLTTGADADAKRYRFQALENRLGVLLEAKQKALAAGDVPYSTDDYSLVMKTGEGKLSRRVISMDGKWYAIDDNGKVLGTGEDTPRKAAQMSLPDDAIMKKWEERATLQKTVIPEEQAKLLQLNKEQSELIKARDAELAPEPKRRLEQKVKDKAYQIDAQRRKIADLQARADDIAAFQDEPPTAKVSPLKLETKSPMSKHLSLNRIIRRANNEIRKYAGHLAEAKRRLEEGIKVGNVDKLQKHLDLWREEKFKAEQELAGIKLGETKAVKGLSSIKPTYRINDNQLDALLSAITDVDEDQGMFIGKEGAARLASADENYKNIMNDLVTARSLEKQGTNEREIFSKTGWLKWPGDGQWRYELSDDQMRILNITDRIVPIQQVIQHPEFNKAYTQEAINQTIKLNSNRAYAAGEGVYREIINYPDTEANIEVSKLTKADAKGTRKQKQAEVRSVTTNSVTHELQHLIQLSEDFNRGGSAANLKNKILDSSLDLVKYKLKIKQFNDTIAERMQELQTYQNELQAYEKGNPLPYPDRIESINKAMSLINDNIQTYKKLILDYESFIKTAKRRKALEPLLGRIQGETEGETNYKLYKHIPGEIEANLAAYRADLTPEQRRASFPLDDLKNIGIERQNLLKVTDDEDQAASFFSSGRVQVNPIPNTGENVPRITDMVKKIGRVFKTTIVTGGIVDKGMLGKYVKNSRLGKVKYETDITTRIHEAVHALDDRTGMADIAKRALSPRQHELENELMILSQSGSKSKSQDPTVAREYAMKEGVAEGVLAWMADPDYVEAQFPNFTKHFKSLVADDIKLGIRDLGDDIRKLRGAPPSAQIRATLPGTKEYLDKSLSEMAKNSLRALRTFTGGDPDVFTTFKVTGAENLHDKWANPYHYLNKAITALKKANGIKELTADNDPMQLLAKVRGAGKILDVLLYKGVPKGGENAKKGEVTTDSLQNISIKHLKKDTAENMARKREMYQARMLAEHTVELHEQRQEDAARVARGEDPLRPNLSKSGPITGIAASSNEPSVDITELQLAKDFLEKELPTWSKDDLNRSAAYAKDARGFMNAVLDYGVEEGLFTPDIRRDKFYISLMRELDDTQLNNLAIAKGRQALYALHGAGKVLKDPEIAMFSNAARIIKLARQNKVNQAFTNLLDITRDFYDDKQGVAEIGYKLTPQEAYTDTTALKVYKQGVAEYYKVNAAFRAALDGYSQVVPENSIINAFGMFSSMLKKGVSLNPGFSSFNYVKDARGRFITSDLPVLTQAKYTAIMTKQLAGEGVKAITRGLGLANTEFGKLLERNLGFDMDELALSIDGGDQMGYSLNSTPDYYRAARTALRKASTDKGNILWMPMRALGNIWEEYTNFIGKVEIAGRLAEYKGQYEKARKEFGWSETQSSLYAAAKARGLMDFAVIAENMRTLEKILPYTNVKVRSIGKMLTVAKERPAQFAIRQIMFSALPALFIREWNAAQGADDEYEQQADYQRTLMNKAKVGANTWVNVPVAPEGIFVHAFVDKLYSYMNGKEDAFDGYAGNMIADLSPIGVAPIAALGKPQLEAIANYDFFRGRNIVPYFETRKALGERDEAQGASRMGNAVQALVGATSIGETRIGKALFSAQGWDHQVKSMFGGAGALMLNATDYGRQKGGKPITWANTFRVVSETPVYGTKSVENVMSFATNNGISSHNPKLKVLQQAINKYFDAVEPEEKQKQADKVREISERMSEGIKSRGVAYFGIHRKKKD